MLRLKEVNYKTRPPRELNIFDGVSLTVKEKEHTIIYGDNGSGKSTLVKLTMGLIDNQSGKIDRPEDGIIAVFEEIETQLLFSTVREELQISSNYREKDPISDILSLEKLLNKSTLELSYSQKARVVFATAYFTDREYMLLDSLPEDDKIDRAISKIVKDDLKTVVILLPYGDKRGYRGKWKKYLIKNSKIERINGT